MSTSDYDRLFNTIEELVLHHSPSGVEGEVDQLIISKFTQLGVEVWIDAAGNAIAKILGKDANRAIAQRLRRSIANCINILKTYCQTINLHLP